MRKALTIWAVVVLATVALVLIQYGTGEDGLRAAIRATARLSAFAIGCAFAGLRRREALIALPISHAAHYVLIGVLAWTTNPANAGMDVITTPGGALLFLLMIHAAVRQSRWAIYMLWIIFLLTFGLRVHESWIYPLVIGLLLAAAVVRFRNTAAQAVSGGVQPMHSDSGTAAPK